MERLSISTEITPQQALERLFTNLELQLDAWFACTSIDFMMLKEQELEQLVQILDCLTDHFGAYQRVEQAEEEQEEEESSKDNQLLLVHFEQGIVPTRICLDPIDGRIVGLSFDNPGAESFPIDPDEAVAKLQQWHGENSLLVLENGTVAAALNAEQPLAVGSTFKLAVLSALKHQIDAGQRSWSDVVELKPEWKSEPTGILQGWVDGSPLTLNTLATLMISISDNTAADALIDILGREAVEEFTEHSRPFLTTREFFLLKHPDNLTLLEQYRELRGDIVNKRREFLQETVDRTPSPSDDVFPNWTPPTALDVEFYFSASELCGLIDRVCDLRLMAINTGGILDPSEWARAALKGGSEPGVFNVTLWLEAHNGKKFHLVLTANDCEAPLNEMRLILLLVRILENLKAR